MMDEFVDNNKASFDPSIEPLLKDNPKRFVILPIEYPDIWQMYKKAEGTFIIKAQIYMVKPKL